MVAPNASSASHKALLATLVLVLAGYATAATLRLPQRATELVVAAGLHHSSGKASETVPPARHYPREAIASHPLDWSEAPFVLLLGAIAVLPLLPATAHWWESNLNRFYVAGGLAALTLAYYLFFHTGSVTAHWPAPREVLPAAAGPNIGQTAAVLVNSVLGEYVPFIVLLFSLYTISGGIRVAGDLPAHPLTNTAFLAIGGILASFVGTTGAAMLLIRPLLETNSERRCVKHTVIFFIFVVCNCGGCLLPIGDPPLFLGYLMGVDFFWTLRLWPEWLFVNGALLLIYFLWDYFWSYRRETAASIARDETRVHHVRIHGAWSNGVLLLGVVASVALLDPSKTVPFTDWHPWMYLREAMQLTMVALSLAIGNGHARRANRFNYAPIIEVAVLFFGIFICMQPPLEVLAVQGSHLGLSQPWHYFWAAGGLSSVLDNAPTYMVFFESAKPLTAHAGLTPAIAGVAEQLLIAISLGSVFMGAMTYIGNGPNFMVKSVAEQSGVAMPGFFGYILYSGLVLVPVLILTTILFL
jgi:Na+/H+ antiporter NhaD/arsenite permease-like protein